MSLNDILRAVTDGLSRADLRRSTRGHLRTSAESLLHPVTSQTDPDAVTRWFAWWHPLEDQDW